MRRDRQRPEARGLGRFVFMDYTDRFVVQACVVGQFECDVARIVPSPVQQGVRQARTSTRSSTRLIRSNDRGPEAEGILSRIFPITAWMGHYQPEEILGTCEGWQG